MIVPTCVYVLDPATGAILYQGTMNINILYTIDISPSSAQFIVSGFDTGATIPCWGLWSYPALTF